MACLPPMTSKNMLAWAGYGVASARPTSRLQETHSCQAFQSSADSFFAAEGVKCFWSPLSTHQGGVAIMCSTRFLSRFASAKPNHLEAGPILRLELRSNSGSNLHLYSVYFPTRCPSDRCQRIRELATQLDPTAHSVLCGDWNFTSEDQDRFVFHGSGQGWKGIIHKKPVSGLGLLTTTFPLPSSTSFLLPIITVHGALGLIASTRPFLSVTFRPGT